jgi:hypothetical protein
MQAPTAMSERPVLFGPFIPRSSISFATQSASGGGWEAVGPSTAMGEWPGSFNTTRREFRLAWRGTAVNDSNRFGNLGRPADEDTPNSSARP